MHDDYACCSFNCVTLGTVYSGIIYCSYLACSRRSDHGERRAALGLAGGGGGGGGAGERVFLRVDPRGT